VGSFLSGWGAFSLWGFFSQWGFFPQWGGSGEAATAIGHKVDQARPPTAVTLYNVHPPKDRIMLMSLMEDVDITVLLAIARMFFHPRIRSRHHI